MVRRRKALFRLRISRILFTAKQRWTTLHMSRPLFVGSYLQAVICRSRGGLSANEKEETFAANDNYNFVFCFSFYVDCYYDGILHEHGERWSPGPCTPECKCDDGKIRCTLIECPELSCNNPIKKRWKCCPECPVEEGEKRER